MQKNLITARRVLAANVIRRRKVNGLTQERLAELADLSQVFISQVERAITNISLDSLVRLALALGCPTHELLKPHK